jgi:hypothetical protein
MERISPRRFPAPWSVEDYDSKCFIVRAANGQKLANVYYEEKTAPRVSSRLPSKDEARRIAANVAKLRQLLRK